jgi:hypothetical protein
MNVACSFFDFQTDEPVRRLSGMAMVRNTVTQGLVTV